MCADGWYCDEKDIKGECPDCGAPTDEDGYAAYGCNYAVEYCKTCGHGGCDGGC